MSLWKIAWRSIHQRSLASFLTALSMALGVALVVAVLVMGGVVGTSFQSSAGLGYNMIVGAKGGALQLVFNTVYHIDRPIENIPYWYFKEFLPASKRGDGKNGKFAEYTDLAIPICMGDYFGNFRVVGTNTWMFDDLEYAPGKKYEFAQGRNFKHDEFFTAVVGANVAREMGVKLGDDIAPTHGRPTGHSHAPFTAVGILKPTGTPTDSAVFINMEGFYLMEGHAREVPQPEGEKAEGRKQKAEGSEVPSPTVPVGSSPSTLANGGQSDVAATTQKAEGGRQNDEGTEPAGDSHQEVRPKNLTPLPENEREITAILLRTKSSSPAIPPELVAPGLVKDINKDNVAQAVLPIGVISRFFDSVIGPLTYVLFALAVLIVIVSGIGIMVSIYNSMSERRHEIAVMRALGAARGKVMLIVLLESILLALGGGLFGWVLGHVLIGVLGPWISSATSVQVGFLQFAPEYELILIPSLILLASLVGYLPALSAYRTDVARALTASP